MSTDRIHEAQKRLGRTLRRARALEDRVLARTVREMGERMAHINYGLLQLTRLHAVGNAAFDRPVEDFQKVLGELINLLGPVHLVCVEDQIYVNDIRVRFEINPEHATAFEQVLRRHNTGGVTYYQPLTGDQIRGLLELFAAEPSPVKPRTSLQQKLMDRGLGSIELQPIFRFRSDSERAAQTIAQVYDSAAGALAEAFANMGTNRIPNPLPIRRIVHEIIDGTAGKDIAAMALATESQAPPFARHPLMVTNLSILIARAARLPDAALADIGVAAMLHDVGFYLERRGRPVCFADHVSAGVEVMLKQRGFHDARIRRLLALIEHHEPYRRPQGPPSLAARVIRIADDYDTLTRPRAGHLCPPDALRAMATHSGDAYDPALLQLFINAMGPYPPGSLLRLTDQRVAVVASGVRSPATFARPVCRVVRLADGSVPAAPVWVDLAREGAIASALRPQR